MTIVPLLLSGIGVALLAGLTAGDGSRRRARARGGERARAGQGNRSRRTSSSKRTGTPSASYIPAPPPPPKAPKRKAKPKPKPAALPIEKEYTITSTKGQPIVPHTVRVRPPEPPPPPEVPAEPPGLSPKAAAQRLYDYAGAMIRAGRASELGTKNARNETVRTYQAAMGRIADDGIYGPETRTRGHELLGKTFPARVAKATARPKPPPPPPATVSIPERETVLEQPVEVVRPAREAAQDLFDYAKAAPKVKGRGAWFGTKLKPNPTVAQAQRDMGGLVDDGIYGPATRKRGRALLGRVFPAR